MNYNLKKLLKDETIPELSNLIVEELKSYGVCQFVKYNDGGFHFNLETEKELTVEELEAVKQIVLNFNKEQADIIEKNREIKQQREQKYSAISDEYMYTFLEELAINIATPKALKWLEEKAKIKNELPTK